MNIRQVIYQWARIRALWKLLGPFYPIFRQDLTALLSSTLQTLCLLLSGVWDYRHAQSRLAQTHLICQLGVLVHSTSPMSLCSSTNCYVRCLHASMQDTWVLVLLTTLTSNFLDKETARALPVCVPTPVWTWGLTLSPACSLARASQALLCDTKCYPGGQKPKSSHNLNWWLESKDSPVFREGHPTHIHTVNL